MKNAISWFEIPTTQLDTAQAFYEAVLDRAMRRENMGPSEGAVFPYDIGGGFVPYRRDVAYVPALEAPILPLLDDFEFVEDRSRWGYKFRFGLFQVSDADMLHIAHAMRAAPELLYF